MSADTRAGVVLVHAPYGMDGDAITEMMHDEFEIESLQSPDEFIARLEQPFGAILLTQEALTQSLISQLNEFLERQASWSNPPLVILLEESLQLDHVRAELERLFPTAKITLLQRPSRVTVLSSVLHSAVISRERQFLVRDHIDLQITLRRELNHRVKNIIATVLSMFRLTKMGTSDREQLTQEFESRLLALSSAHDALFQQDYGEIGLEELLRKVVEPFQARLDTIRLSGPEQSLDAEAALMIALSMHELCTNASKYGALSSDHGHVSLTWESGDGELVLDWTESGGPPVTPPHRKGYGTIFLETVFGRNFGGDVVLEYLEEGLSAKLRALLNRVEPKAR